MKNASEFLGRLVGNYLTEKSLAIAVFAGHPEIALIWAFARSIRK